MLFSHIYVGRTEHIIRKVFKAVSELKTHVSACENHCTALDAKITRITSEKQKVSVEEAKAAALVKKLEELLNAEYNSSNAKGV
jgi:septal ring factor EnvC (AmiA/AmiB activator)